MALQDLLGQAWPHYPLSAPRAADEGRRRERSLWSHHRGHGSPDRRPPPSGRMRAAHMPRRVFLALVFGRGTIVAALLGVILAIRWLG
ncbi:MAG TPA: hypothetical protein VII40_19200 [Xanthobacteraceae bacterium]